MQIFADRWSSALGELLIAVRADGVLARLVFIDPTRPVSDVRCHVAQLTDGGDEVMWRPRQCAHVRRHVTGYLSGKSRKLELETIDAGTAFQRTVWRAVRRVRYGSTISYGELAERVGRPTAVRAVARANADNPFCLVIPSHRVVGSGGALTGFCGGVEIKARLLELEGAKVP